MRSPAWQKRRESWFRSRTIWFSRHAEDPFWYSWARSREPVSEVGILERGRREGESLAPILTPAQTHPRTVVTTLGGAGSGLTVGAAGPATWRSDVRLHGFPFSNYHNVVKVVLLEKGLA